MDRLAGLARAVSAAALTALIALSACAAPAGPDASELANIDTINVVPKSFPRQIAQAFESHCIDAPASYGAAEARLRAEGFVPLPPRDPGVVAFVSDDKRPMVLVSRDGASCLVGARSRTGQTAALNGLVAERFPAARPLDPAQLARFGLEQGWQVDGGIVYLKRIASAFSDSRLMFGIWRTT